MIELSHILVEVVLVPLIHPLPIGNDRFKTHLLALIKDVLELLLKGSKFLIQAWVLEAIRSLPVRLLVSYVDALSFLLLALFAAFNCW